MALKSHKGYLSYNIQGETVGVKVELVDNSFQKLRGEIRGPPDTPFEDGTYIVDIVIPETYPFNPPKVSFASNIYMDTLTYSTCTSHKIPAALSYHRMRRLYFLAVIAAF